MIASNPIKIYQSNIKHELHRIKQFFGLYSTMKIPVIFIRDMTDLKSNKNNLPIKSRDAIEHDFTKK
jgi:hypothetical protein